MPIVWNIREYDKSKGRIATSDRFLVEDVAHLHHIQSKIASYSEWLTDLRAHPVNLSNSAVEELQPKLYEYTQLVGLKAVYKPYSFK